MSTSITASCHRFSPVLIADSEAPRDLEMGTAGRPTSTDRGFAIPERLLQRLVRRLDSRERELRAKIVEERDRVQDVAMSDLDGGVGDSVDRAFATTQLAMERDMIDRCMMQLDEIAHAYERIATGDIGVCVDCDEPIDSARLDANPVAVRCTECQSRREMRSALGG
jgi:RNA polymerase-binding protein DksA